MGEFRGHNIYLGWFREIIGTPPILGASLGGSE
jgi:hypothetical protein